MNIDKILANTEKAYEKYKEQRNKIATRDIFIAFKNILEKDPEIEFFYFQYYTPYFNDGEPCYPYITPLMIGFKDGKEDYYSSFRSNNNETLKNAQILLNKLSALNIIENIFDIDVTVRITRDELTVESYTDHD